MKRRFVAIAVLLIALAAPAVFLRPFYEPAVLMYHRIGYPDSNPGLFVSPEVFERQMEFLKIHNYHVVSLAYLISIVKSGQPVPMNTVVITFDDGYLDNFVNAFPVLKKMDFPATIFMITDNIGKEGWLTEEDLRVLQESSVVIGAHTQSHAFLPPLIRGQMESEIGGSKSRLEAILGRPVTLFSYPAGGVSEEVEQVVRDAGFDGAVTTNYRVRSLDPYALRRVKISDAHGNLFNFWAKTSGFYQVGKKKVEAMASGE